MEERTRPTAGSTVAGAAAALVRTHALYDKANQDVQEILSMVTEVPASFLVRKHRPQQECRATDREHCGADEKVPGSYGRSHGF